MLLKIIR